MGVMYRYLLHGGFSLLASAVIRSVCETSPWPSHCPALNDMGRVSSHMRVLPFTESSLHVFIWSPNSPGKVFAFVSALKLEN